MFRRIRFFTRHRIIPKTVRVPVDYIHVNQRAAVNILNIHTYRLFESVPVKSSRYRFEIPKRPFQPEHHFRVCFEIATFPKLPSIHVHRVFLAQ